MARKGATARAKTVVMSFIVWDRLCCVVAMLLMWSGLIGKEACNVERNREEYLAVNSHFLWTMPFLTDDDRVCASSR
jgi:hypothetical protein